MALTISSGVSLFAAEGAFRYMLFGESALALKLGEQFRRPQLFCDAGADVDYHKLRRIWNADGARTRSTNLDGKLGWMSSFIKPPDYTHKDAKTLGTRRPFLFYGDSFTACVLPQEDCWEGLMSQTAFDAELATINYGTRAFGLDQTALLYEESIGQWMPRNPIVAIGILVDDDLDRTVFNFRGCPKPRYRVVDGELQAELPGEFEIDEWVEEHPPQITSYLFRYMAYHKRWVPEGWGPARANDPEVVEEKIEVSRALIESLQSKLEARGIEYFFVLFYGPIAWREQSVKGWRDTFLTETLDGLGIPWVSSRSAMQTAGLTLMKKEKVDPQQEFFFRAGTPSGGHFTRAGNQAALPAIMRGLCGVYEGAVKQRATSVKTPLPAEAALKAPAKSQ